MTIYAYKTLPDGRIVEVYPLTFGRARLGIRRSETEMWYLDEW